VPGPSGGISGLAVAFAAAGGLLVYAGFKNLSPVGALKDVSGGRPSGVDDRSTELSGAPIAGVATGVADQVLGGNVMTAANKYIGDKYSQLRREQPGYSDCSSFADKVLSDIGIPPPTKWAATSNYRASGHWKTIPQSEAGPGDIAISSHHMVVVASGQGAQAVGQQNPRVNVRTGSVASLMGSQSYVYKRYTP
jgi:hypothetical protein